MRAFSAPGCGMPDPLKLHEVIVDEPAVLRKATDDGVQVKEWTDEVAVGCVQRIK
jgi:hypothetical protein